MSILIGTQGWNYSAWVGPLYPAGTRTSEFVPAYARAFRAVGVAATFYAVPDATAVSANPTTRCQPRLALVDQPIPASLSVRSVGPDREITDYSRGQFARSEEMRAWSEVLKRAALAKDIFGFFNNHFAGHRPASAR